METSEQGRCADHPEASYFRPRSCADTASSEASLAEIFGRAQRLRAPTWVLCNTSQTSLNVSNLPKQPQLGREGDARAPPFPRASPGRTRRPSRREVSQVEDVAIAGRRLPLSRSVEYVLSRLSMTSQDFQLRRDLL